MEDDKLYLTEDELVRYELATPKRDLGNAELHCLDLEQQLYQKDLEICKLRVQLSSHKIIEKRRKLKDFKDSHKTFNGEVCERLNIESGRFTYDPLTREVLPVTDEGE